MQLIPYAQLLTMSKEKVDASLATARAKSQKLRGDLEVAKLDEEIASLETKVTELCSKKDLDYSAIVLALDSLDLAKRRQGQMTEIVKQLFPSEA